MFAKENHDLKVTKEAVLDADATTINELIQERKITSTEVLTIYKEYIEMVNPAINSIVENRFKTALTEAKVVDQKLSQENLSGKLQGVPISMKDSFDVMGMATTGGLTHRIDKFATKDAEVVRKLKQEGAIILGKTNTPELCFCQETDNKLYGKTNNPRDLSRTVGGSSGGEAATIAIGAASAGLGSDIGGSIRLPSHFNGVVGFKSGKFQVSSTGSFPEENHPLQSRMLGIGPIAKSVQDAELIYSIIAKEKPIKKELTNFTMNILPSTVYPLSNETAHLLNEAYEKLKAQFLVERIEPPYFHETAGLWQEIMSINGGAMAKNEAFENKTPNLLSQYIKEKISGAGTNHRYLLWALIGASLFKPNDKRVKEIQEKVEKGDEILEDYLANRILLFPIYHSGAPKHGVVYSEIFSIRKTFKKYMPYLAYANVWGLPSLTVPVGKDHTGMPIAVQLMSKIGNEDALFKLGYQLEEMFTSYERALL